MRSYRFRASPNEGGILKKANITIIAREDAVKTIWFRTSLKSPDSLARLARDAAAFLGDMDAFWVLMLISLAAVLLPGH